MRELICLLILFVSFNSYSQGNFSDEQLIIGVSPELWDYQNLHSVDIDNDGDLDIVTSSIFGAKIVCFYNNGSGCFTGYSVIYNDENGHDPNMTISDMNDDGFLDIISYNNRFINIHQNYGNGTFETSEVEIDVHLIRPYNFDLDGDQDADIVLIGREKIVTCFNQGNAEFEFVESDIVVPLATYNAFMVDLNNDNQLDICLIDDDNSRELIWYVNDGLGEFMLEDTLVNDQPVSNKSMILYDLDEDGFEDIVYGGFYNGVFWNKNTGNGSLDSAQLVVNTSFEVKKIFFFDLDSDGDNDLVTQQDTMAFTENNVYYWFENDGGTYSTETFFEITSNSIVKLHADYNNDGFQDLLITNEFNTILSYSANLGNSKFSNAKYIHSLTSNSGCCLELIDINNDEDVDFVSSMEGFADHIWLHENSNEPEFNSPYLLSDGFDVFRYLIKIEITDINSDDFDDILALGRSNSIRWYENDKMGHFVEHEIDLSVFRNSEEVTAFASGDLNGDNKSDILLSSALGGLFYLKNDGSYNFSERVIIDSNQVYLTRIVSKDFDLDGDIDIVFKEELSPNLFFLENNGSGVFGDKVDVGSFSFIDITYIEVVDIDLDGDLDILPSYLPSYLPSFGQDLKYLENVGSGLFIDKVFATNLVEPILISVQTFNFEDDLDLDIVYYSKQFNEIRYFTKEPGNTFSNKKVLISDVKEIIAFKMIDVDGDGDEDIIASLNITDVNSSRIVWYENLSGEFTNVPKSLTNIFERVKVYPNPASDKIYLDFERELSSNYDIVFTDISGKELKRHNNLYGSKIELDVRELINGTYFIILYEHGNSVILGSQKIVIN